MTTIVGVQYADKVVIATDNQVTDGEGRRFNHPDLKKVVEKGPYLIAGSGEVHPCDVAQVIWQPPRLTAKDKADLYKFMVVKVLPSLRTCLTENGFDFSESKGDSKSVEQRFHFLIAVGGELFDIGDDFSICRSNDGWYAIGSGAGYALGALAMGATPQEAVEASCKFSVYSSGPVITLEQSR
jgi:ATP-dependent protease HslVU (ClpYQ) peptidase subunit